MFSSRNSYKELILLGFEDLELYLKEIVHIPYYLKFCYWFCQIILMFVFTASVECSIWSSNS